MLFSSLEFIFLFLPVALITYYVTPKRFKNFILFILSVLFYAFGEIRLLPIFLLTVFASYIFGIIVGRCKRKGAKRAVLIL